MSNREQLEQYWHWFHGLVGISQKEKEVLLKICPEVKIWYEFAKQKKTYLSSHLHLQYLAPIFPHCFRLNQEY